MSLRDTILAADDLDLDVVHVPEWNIDVGVQSMTGTARAGVIEVAQNADKDGGAKVGEMWFATLASCLVDPATSEPIFETNDEDELMGKSSAVIDRLWNLAWAKSGLGDDAEADAGKDSSDQTD